MMRSIAIRLAAMFGLLGLLVFSIAGLALYHALAHTLSQELDAELREKLAMVETMVVKVRTVDRWGRLRAALNAITDADDAVEIWISCSDAALTYGERMPAIAMPADGQTIHAAMFDDPAHPIRVLGKRLRPIEGSPDVDVLVGMSTRPNAETLGKFALLLVIVSACSVAIVSALGYWVARIGLRPLTRLSAAVSALNPANLSQRLSLPRPARELSRLVGEFNHALERIELAYDQLKGFNADVAHELRTPIGNIIGQTQVALIGDGQPEALREALQSNLEELERLRAIVNDMLFLARADRGEAAAQLAPVSLRDEAGKVIEFLEILLEQKGLRISVEGDAEALAEAGLVRRALSNLLRNAIQFSAPGASIRVLAGIEAGQARVVVENPGEPVPPARLGRLFDRFYRMDSARASSSDNYGLGLAIVKAIAQMHGGTVIAYSADGHNGFGLSFGRHPAAGGSAG